MVTCHSPRSRLSNCELWKRHAEYPNRTDYRLQSLDTEYSVHLYWDHSEPDVPEGWAPNLPAKFLKLAETTSDRRYGWISQVQYGRFLTKTPQIDEDVRKNRIGLLAKIPRLARD